MKANLSFEKKSSRAPLTEGCCRLAFPCVRPTAGTAPFCLSSRQTWISARPLYSVVQLLICSRPFQSKNSNVRGEVGGRERQGERGRKKNTGTEGKCRRDKHASSLRSKKVVNREQAMSALWLGSKGGLASVCGHVVFCTYYSGETAGKNILGGKWGAHIHRFPLGV